MNPGNAVLLLVYAATLLLAVIVSERAGRTVLSTALSVVLPSSADVPVARWFRSAKLAPGGDRAHVSG